MKTPFWLRRSAFALCLAAFGQSSHSLAQEQKSPVPLPPGYAQPASQAPAPAPPGYSRSPYVLEIKNTVLLRNGKPTAATLANVVDALREMWTDSDIAVAPEVAKVWIEDLKLRSVSELPDVLEALRVASGYRFEWRKGSPGRATDPATGLPAPGPASQSSPLYVLDLGLDSQGKALGHARRVVEAFNLSGYLDQSVLKGKTLVARATSDQEVQECLSQIEKIILQTLSSLNGNDIPESDQPNFQFHPGAGLLIVIGPPEAIDVARKVVTALPGMPPSPRSEALGVANPEQDPGYRAARAARDAFYRRYGVRPRTAPESTNAPAQPEQAPPAETAPPR